MVSYPSSPTWMVYHGTEPRCVEDTPLLILADLFCTHFLAEAGEFTVYKSWVLIHHLRMAGLITSSVPGPVFDLKTFTTTDSGCFANNFPTFRRLNHKFAANLMGSSQEVLMTQHVAPLQRPVASFRAHFDRFQGQHGWQYIAIDENGISSVSWWIVGLSHQMSWLHFVAIILSFYFVCMLCPVCSGSELHGRANTANVVLMLSFVHVTAGNDSPLEWTAADGGLTENGKWTCSGSPNHPFIGRTAMHPCALPGQECCQGHKAAVGVRYVSNLWDMAASAELTFEVWPTCGDGLTINWILTHGNTTTTLFSKEFTAAAESVPHRETIQLTIAVFPGDTLMFVVSAGANHDCDGVYIHDITVWAS